VAISIPGTPTPQTPPSKDGDSFDLMVTLLRARQAADRCHSLAKQTEHGRHPFLSKFWNEIAELHMDVLRRTATAVERLREEASEDASAKGEQIPGGLKTDHQRGTGSKNIKE